MKFQSADPAEVMVLRRSAVSLSLPSSHLLMLHGPSAGSLPNT